jgi:L-lactate utilization protein LutC
MVNEDLVRKFKAKAVEAGAEVETFADAAGAIEFIVRFMANQHPAKVVAAPDALEFVPRDADFDLLEPASMIGYAPAEAGLVRADKGVAATGTLVHWDKGEEDRIVWTLPPVCLCVLKEDAVVAELDDIAGLMAEHLAPVEAPSFAQVSLVTGPSRTADIEGELSLGVHGPGRLIILLLRS